MSILETNAKELAEKVYAWEDEGGDHWQYCKKIEYFTQVFAEILEDAQKEISELKLVADSAHKNAQWTMDANRRQVEHIKELEAKIEAATKIIAELDIGNFATGETRKDGTEYHHFNIDQWYAKLKAALEVSRKEEAEKEKTA